MSSRLHLPAASLAGGDELVAITPGRAGWRYAGLSVVRLEPGARREIRTGDREMLVLPVTGGCTIETGNAVAELPPRPSVFAAVSGFVYLPPRTDVMLASERGAEVALPYALAEHGTGGVRQYAAGEVAIEVRGAGRATRQINELFTAANSRAERLAVVEVITPGGNWSSYPPHKHDADGTAPGEEVLEEIYWFRIAGEQGWGVHRTYTADGTIDETVAVRDRDAFLVPRGYHGPCAAPPEFPMYYLNVLAGPGGERRLGFSDDPAYAWIRDTWAEQEPDSRVPFVRRGGA